MVQPPMGLKEGPVYTFLKAGEVEYHARDSSRVTLRLFLDKTELPDPSVSLSTYNPRPKLAPTNRGK